MSVPILTREQWAAVRDTAIALDDLAAAADQYGIPRATVRQRAHRERWPVASRRADAIAGQRFLCCPLP